MSEAALITTIRYALTSPDEFWGGWKAYEAEYWQRVREEVLYPLERAKACIEHYAIQRQRKWDE